MTINVHLSWENGVAFAYVASRSESIGLVTLYAITGVDYT